MTVVYYGRWISAIHKVIQILEIAGDLSNMMSNIVSVFLHATGNGSKEPRTCVTSIVPCHIFQACSLKSKTLKTRRRMARERRGAESSVVSMETLY